jgi:hypothetical protein
MTLKSSIQKYKLLIISILNKNVNGRHEGSPHDSSNKITEILRASG